MNDTVWPGLAHRHQLALKAAARLIPEDIVIVRADFPHRGDVLAMLRKARDDIGEPVNEQVLRRKTDVPFPASDSNCIRERRMVLSPRIGAEPICDSFKLSFEFTE